MSSEAPDLGTVSWYDKRITGFDSPTSLSRGLMGAALGGGGGRGRSARAVNNELRMHAIKQSITSAHDIATHAGKSDVDTAALKDRGEMLQQQSTDFHKSSIDDKMSHWSKMYEEARNLPEGHPEKEARLKALSNIDQFVHAPGGFSVSGLGSVDSGKPSLSYNVGRKADDPIKLSGDPYTPPTPPAATGPIPIPPTPPGGGGGGGGGGTGPIPIPPTPPAPPKPPVPPKPPAGGGGPGTGSITPVDEEPEISKTKGFPPVSDTSVIPKIGPDAITTVIPTIKPDSPKPGDPDDATTVLPAIKPEGAPPTGEVPDRAARRRRPWERR